MFDTPEADAILSAMQVFPPDNPWNQDISALPVHRDSARMIASIGADKSLGYNLDMGFIIVPPDQKKVPVKLLLYPAESDPGPVSRCPTTRPSRTGRCSATRTRRRCPRPGRRSRTSSATARATATSSWSIP